MTGPKEPDEDTRELVVRLLTRAGMMMEDASAIAVLSAGEGVEMPDVVAQLEKASTEVGALIAAAKALLPVQEPMEI